MKKASREDKNYSKQQRASVENQRLNLKIEKDKAKRMIDSKEKYKEKERGHEKR